MGPVPFANPIDWILGFVLIVTSLGVILARRPVYASLSFLGTLLTLAALYLQLSAEFIAVMQVLVYAGAILVLFMVVIVLFQDAHQHIAEFPAKSWPILLISAASIFLFAFGFLGKRMIDLNPSVSDLKPDFGMVESLGMALYVDFCFPFEALSVLFLVAAVGTLYIAKKAV